MRQIAERMAERGHDVTVATSRHPQRKSKVVNGVKIREFKAGGKMVYLAPTRVNLGLIEERWPEIEFMRTRENLAA